MSRRWAAKGGFAAAESYAWHRYLIVSKGDVYDPRVGQPNFARRSQSAGLTISILLERAAVTDCAHGKSALRPNDALILPTTANTPPRIADLADDKAFTAANLLALRNCTLINMIERLRHLATRASRRRSAGGTDAGAAGGSDRRIFELAAGMEAVIRV